ncbi:MAG: hypothetical protein DMF04_11870 [Verrucomicrobia bacterium]|nr:MAG: hypothetical protein DMF04_11870 [Verrucomicrobiota bacterium]
MKSISVVMLSCLSAKPQLSGSPLLLSVALRTGTQTKGFVAGGRFLGVSVAGVSAVSKSSLGLVPAFPSNLSLSNLVWLARSPNPPTISK